MIESPDEFIPSFAEAGATWISVHQEACILKGPMKKAKRLRRLALAYFPHCSQ
jgi:pentose-5-phosphate-3-epimerase